MLSTASSDSVLVLCALSFVTICFFFNWLTTIKNNPVEVDCLAGRPAVC